jgi:peptide deformylase
MRSIRTPLAAGLLGNRAPGPADPAVPPIVQAGDLVLRSRAAEVAPEKIASKEMQALVTTMIATMRGAPGVGLAAPQIGVPLRVIVLEDRPEYVQKVDPKKLRDQERTAFGPRVFFNPSLRLVGGERVTFLEGCLSVAGFTALVERAHEVEVEGLDEKGAPQTWRVRGWPARILQHECDHLDGTLYVDRMLTRSFCSVEQAQTHYGDRSVAELRRMLGV